MRYRKKPVVIEAVEWKGTPESFEEILNMGLGKWTNNELDPRTFFINTLEGNMLVSKGDFVIKGVNGEFYPCKPDIFHKTYEPVE